MAASSVEVDSETNEFHSAMKQILRHLPEGQLAQFHPTLGVIGLWHNAKVHKVFAVTRDAIGKDAKKSAEYRQKGNKLFQEKKFDEALEMYNLSVMYAPYPAKTTKGVSAETQTHTNGEGNSKREQQEHEAATDKIMETTVTEEEEKEDKNGSQKRNNHKRNRKRKTKRGQSKNPEHETNGVVETNKEAPPNTEQESRQANGKSKTPEHETNGVAESSKESLNTNGKTEDIAEGSASKTETLQNGSLGSDRMKVENQVQSQQVEDSLAMAYVVANRSACLFFVHLYKECMADIDFALKLGYPDSLVYKLYERKAKCLVQIGRSQEAIEYLEKATMCVGDADLDGKGKQTTIFSLAKQIKQIREGKVKIKSSKPEIQFIMDSVPNFTAKRSRKFHCASSAFQMALSDAKGRHVLAAEDVGVGDILSSEEPYSSILYPEYYTTHCNRCLARVVVATPCRDCSRVLYCSRKCEQEAWDLYHQVECPVLSWLRPTWVGRLGHLALRTVLIAGYTNLKTYFNNDSEEATLKRMSAFNNDGTYSTGYNSIYHLVNNLPDRSPENIFNFALIAVLLMKVYFKGVACLFQSCGEGQTSSAVTEDGASTTSGDKVNKMAPQSGGDETTAVPPIGPGQKQLEIVSRALIHHLQIVQCNGFAIPEMQGKDDFRTYVPRDIGVGLYPVHGLLNHSCDPDLDLCFYGNRMLTRAIKGVAKGNEICLDYGVLYFTQTRDVRQSTLREQYYFTCNCPACEGDWPVWHEIEATHPTLRCGACRVALPSAPPGAPTPSHVICLCGHETAVLKNLSLLNESHHRYAIALRLKGESDNDAILLALIDHLTLMDKFICPPWREYVSCQSSVKQSFRLMGNWFRVRGEVPPAE